ncbi:MAG TPA: prepilin-type N-terminal cleavage/methylation domain-containing protein [Candidatus Hydrogenedentes bacterium]|nr:prepilin-type N-terminal cleavage/methylation domain-containing protein [Candidatus Hydrogenedentota bacterium]
MNFPACATTIVPPQCRLPWRRAGGFTLIELSVVIFLIALISAIAFPQLAPVIMFTELEGEARHLSNYGRAAIAESTLFRADITVRFDLDNQEYYCIRVVYPEPESDEGEPAEDQMALLSQLRGSGMSTADLGGILSSARMQGDTLGLPDGFDDEAANRQLSDKFDRFARRVLEERAKNVKQEESLLDEIGPLFDPEDKFSLDLAEPEEQELVDPALQRVLLSPTVRLESVIIDGVAQSRGVAEVKLSPLGLSSEVGFYLVNEDEEYFTVIWDPLTGGTNILDGKQDI